MLLERWHQSIVRVRAGTKTERGSVMPDWSNPDRLTIDGCLFNPNSTALDQDGRVLGIRTGAALYAPCDADIKAGDRIQVGDDVYTIDGEPLIWSNVGKLNHMQVNLQRWQG
ncbi:MAG: hypothetical protein IKP03_10920 [Fibrobacter sp.]|nr:hypothetical protein [Fibrobacter sp.]